MSSRFDSVLQESLDALEQNVPIEEILARYPDHTDNLAPILEATTLLGDLHQRPSTEARRRSREAFLSESRDAAAGVLVFDRKRRFQFSPLKAAAGLVLALGLGAVIVLAGRQPSQAELTGLNSWLAGIPQIADPAQFEVIPPQIELVEDETPSPVFSTSALQGTVEAIYEGGMTVDGFEVVVSDTTIVEGEVMVGSLVVVEGEAQEGRLLATLIRVLDEDVPEETATPVQPVLIPSETTPPPPVVTQEVTSEPDDGGGGEITDEPDDDTPEPEETDEPDEPDPPDEDDSSGSGEDDH